MYTSIYEISYRSRQLVVRRSVGSVIYGNDKTARREDGVLGGWFKDGRWIWLNGRRCQSSRAPGSGDRHKLCPHTKWRICRKLDGRRPSMRQWTCQGAWWDDVEIMYLKWRYAMVTSFATKTLLQRGGWIQRLKATDNKQREPQQTSPRASLQGAAP